MLLFVLDSSSDEVGCGVIEDVFSERVARSEARAASASSA